jgi:hypothetical protein
VKDDIQIHARNNQRLWQIEDFIPPAGAEAEKDPLSCVRMPEKTWNAEPRDCEVSLCCL